MCGCVSMCVSACVHEDKWSNSLITSAGPGEYRQREGGVTEWTDTALISAFPPPLPPILHDTLSRPPRCSLPTSQDPQEGSYLNGRGSGPWGVCVCVEGGLPLSTLTQLVRLIKRVCGLWGQSSTPPRDRKTKEVPLFQRYASSY